MGLCSRGESLVLRDRANSVSFGFHDHASAAQRAGGRQRSHRMADTVSKVPSGFHAALKRPLKLAGRYAFLGRAKQMDRLKPQAQR